MSVLVIYFLMLEDMVMVSYGNIEKSFDFIRLKFSICNSMYFLN